MTIKKAYVELIELLEANQNKKVSTILEEIKLMCSSKNASGSELGTTFVKDDEGITIAIYCYYFKKWMSVDQVEFGKKASTASGYNTMCKEGVRNWTRQQREAKVAKEALLQAIVDGDCVVEELSAKQEEIELHRKRIIEAEEPLLHFDTYEELTASEI